MLALLLVTRIEEEGEDVNTEPSFPTSALGSPSYCKITRRAVDAGAAIR